jgi:3'-5' exoribonuclease
MAVRGGATVAWERGCAIAIADLPSPSRLAFTRVPPTPLSVPARNFDAMTALPHAFIRDFGDSGYVEGVYSIVNPQLGTTRQGKAFLKCLLRDASGEIPARKWTFDESSLPAVSATGFVFIRGNVQRYQEQRQLIVEEIDPATPSAAQIAELLPASSRDLGEMFAELSAILRSLEHPGMRALMEGFLESETLMERFRRAPAATSLHHAYIGGLLEHTLQLLQVADRILPLYPGLNRDIVLAGLFLHDLGKTMELSWEGTFAYTAAGNLLGHTVQGVILLRSTAAKVRQSGHDIPEAALLVLQHIVLSHHGQLEFGATKVPATPEAIFVHHLDNLDAKTTMSLSQVDRADLEGRRETGQEFTDRVWFLDTRLYRPDPLKA